MMIRSRRHLDPPALPDRAPTPGAAVALAGDDTVIGTIIDPDDAPDFHAGSDHTDPEPRAGELVLVHWTDPTGAAHRDGLTPYYWWEHPAELVVLPADTAMRIERLTTLAHRAAAAGHHTDARQYRATADRIRRTSR